MNISPNMAAPVATAEARRVDLLRFEAVGKRFEVGGRSFAAVRDVNLVVGEGEFVTILGPSGCGKSTLLNMIAGILKPSEGTVTYRSQPIEGLNFQSGYVTQTDHLLPWRTVKGNVVAPLEIRKVPRRDAERRVSELLELVGLAEFANAYPTQISGGMRKRVVLARLLAQDPETLLMDEPFVALDAQMRLAMQTELRRLCKELRKTVLFVTHDVDEAAALGDRCAVFTARPGTIDRIVDIDLPVQRDLASLRSNPAYGQVAAYLWSLMTPYINVKRG